MYKYMITVLHYYIKENMILAMSHLLVAFCPPQLWPL